MKAVFLYEGKSIDYVPVADVAAGDVVVIGDMIGIAQFNIPAGALGTVALTGVWNVEKDAAAITAGAKVYWNATDKVATATVGANVLLGHAVAAAADDADTVQVRINDVVSTVTVNASAATEAEIKTGTDAVKFVTPKALADGANEDDGYVKVNQAATIANLTDAATGAQIATAVNAVIAVLKTHGLIAAE